ncbi:hypothetical protein THMIRHAS_01120 [Thiosulfatimonas sediminis]|uniref:Protein BatD n=2 Tax=Thiosulfatimonas sediminis TaxID=2675054 RepID=A0A6F8PRK0_9GAMM|nr:hypothetical protein THMIRHAS_01120 [Thiosulfatimonas sediminis]
MGVIFSWQPAKAAVVSVSDRQIQLGEALHLQVRASSGESLQKVLADLPWQQWQEDFIVQQHSYSSDRATYYLYPYQVGPFELVPSVHFTGKKGVVLPNSMVNIEWQKGVESSVFQRQSWPWRAQIRLADSGLRVSLEAFIGGDWQKNPLGLGVSFGQQSLLSGEIVGELASWYQWQPLLAEELNLQAQPQRFYSPVVVVQQPNSNRPWKFFDRPLDLMIKPLPSFLPPQVLLGHLSLQPQAVPFWGMQGDLLYWQWQVSGAQMSQAEFIVAMQQLLAEQPKNSEFEWFAPTIEFSQTSQSQAQVRIPMRLQGTGKILLPRWQWRYFDLQSGKLAVQQAPQQQIWVLAAWQQYSVFAAAVGLVVSGVLLFFMVLRFYWLRWQLLNWLKHQENPALLAPELWRASARLLAQPVMQSWRAWQQQVKATDALRERLEKSAYSRASDGAWREELFAQFKHRQFSLATFKNYIKWLIKVLQRA